MDYRTLMSAFPSGVSVITAVDADGHPHGLTCTSLSSVTLNPPTLLACLNTRSPALAALRAVGEFAVNLLHAKGQRAAEVFSSPVADRFSLLPWRRTERAGLPWLTEHAFAVAECAVSHIRVVGDHAVVFGEVHTVTQDQDRPLLYGLRRFTGWSAEGEV
ncbi:flavin reductase family protein [Kutzneria albida]|nr:flavin reductase family protein [Kutzneria albida]